MFGRRVPRRTPSEIATSASPKIRFISVAYCGRQHQSCDLKNLVCAAIRRPLAHPSTMPARCRYCCKSAARLMRGSSTSARWGNRPASSWIAEDFWVRRFRLDAEVAYESVAGAASGSPHMCTRKSRPRLGKNATDRAKRLLQHISANKRTDAPQQTAPLSRSPRRRWASTVAGTSRPNALAALQIDHQNVPGRRLHQDQDRPAQSPAPQ